MSKFSFLHRKKMSVQPLRVDGIAPAPLTPEPSKEELAASRILSPIPNNEAVGGGAAKAYRIKEALAMEERAVTRYVAYCEQQLSLPSLTGKGSVERLQSLEQGLYDRQDVAERVGGNLFRRWQSCLAEVTIRLMKNE